MSNQSRSSAKCPGTKTNGSFLPFVLAFALSAIGQFALTQATAGDPGANAASPFSPWFMLGAAIVISSGGILTLRSSPRPSPNIDPREKKVWPLVEILIGAVSALSAGMCVQLLIYLSNEVDPSITVTKDWVEIILIGLAIVIPVGCFLFWVTKIVISLPSTSTPAEASDRYSGNFVVVIAYLLIGRALFRRGAGQSPQSGEQPKVLSVLK